MKNEIKSFSLFVRPDKASKEIANQIRSQNLCAINPLEEKQNDGDLIIAIGGDGTFIDSVVSTNFSKTKIYAGVNTGTLGFLQNVYPSEIFSLIKYLTYEKEIKTRKIGIVSVVLKMCDGATKNYNSLNEVIISGEHKSAMDVSMYVKDQLLQNVKVNDICVATTTGDTAYSKSARGPIILSDYHQMICSLSDPIENAVCERIITNSIVCTEMKTFFKHDRPKNLELVIDGVFKGYINQDEIESIEFYTDENTFINQLELRPYSKVKAVREKILGYDD